MSLKLIVKSIIRTRWATLPEIEQRLRVDGHYNIATSISARIREIRSDGLAVEKRRRKNTRNLWEYRAVRS